MYKALGCVVLVMMPVIATAEDFDYEINLGFTQIDIDSTVTTTLPGFPSTTSADDASVRSLSLGGTWFFDGLSDDKGPRAQAAFVDRASSLSARYADISGDADASDISLLGRYVWKNSGWFVGGSYADNEQGGSTDVDVSQITATVGKYIGETTSIDLSLIRQEVEFDAQFFGSQSTTNSGAVLSFDHLGTLSTQWQYAAGVSVSSESFNGASGSYTANFSLYPNRDVSLSAGITGELGGGGNGGTAFNFGAGWFFTPQLQGRVSVGFFDVGNDGPQSSFVEVDTDNTQIGASIRYRF